jgi:hypothetical protein
MSEEAKPHTLEQLMKGSAAVHAYDFGHLRTPLPGSHPQLERLARLQGADADA